MFPESLYFWEIQYSTLKLHIIQNSHFVQIYNSASNVFYSYPTNKTLSLLETVKVLATFLEHILCKRFQLFCHILNDASSITQGSSLQCWFQTKEQEKYQLEPGEECMGDTPVLSHRSLLRNPWPKPAGVLEHCHEGNPNRRFSIFHLTVSLRQRTKSWDRKFLWRSNSGKL
jgi:hypothetical protein